VAVLDRIANWLGLYPEFSATQKYRKQSALTLEETIANYDEVAQALAGTGLESCLEDERMYRAERTDQPGDARVGRLTGGRARGERTPRRTAGRAG